MRENLEDLKLKTYSYGASQASDSISSMLEGRQQPRQQHRHSRERITRSAKSRLFIRDVWYGFHLSVQYNELLIRGTASLQQNYLHEWYEHTLSAASRSSFQALLVFLRKPSTKTPSSRPEQVVKHLSRFH